MPMCLDCGRSFDQPSPSGYATCIKKHGDVHQYMTDEQKEAVRAKTQAGQSSGESGRPRRTRTVATRPPTAPFERGPAPGAEDADGGEPGDSGPARRSRWRGRTAVYVNKAGERYMVYHNPVHNKRNGAWTHPYDERCEEACQT